MANIVRDLSFADNFILAQLVEHPRDFLVEDAVVVNLCSEPMVTGREHSATIPPWKSTCLKGDVIKSGERAGLFRVKNKTNLGGCVFRGWEWLGHHVRSFPRDTPLYRSAFDHVGSVRIDPYVFTRERSAHQQIMDFNIRLNLWWSPGDTDAFIHNEHPFLEVHTQVHGLGRMQKFRQRDQSTLYEEVHMAIGTTHEPFCRVAGQNSWVYPWHRYYADTDAVWLAIELHPK